MISKLQNLLLSNVFPLCPVACCLKVVAFECLLCWCHPCNHKKSKIHPWLKTLNIIYFWKLYLGEKVFEELHVNIQGGTKKLQDYTGRGKKNLRMLIKDFFDLHILQITIHKDQTEVLLLAAVWLPLSWPPLSLVHRWHGKTAWPIAHMTLATIGPYHSDQWCN